MKQAYEYAEDELEEGITFKKVGYFIKKAWLRAVIYMLACVLLVGVVVVPIRVFYKSEPIASTSIEFIYDGIEEGLAPDDKPFNKESIISTTVLASAVDAAALSDKIKDISELANSVRIEGVNTDEYVALMEAAANGDAAAANTLRNYKMYPTKFNIIISNPKKLDLNDTQAKQLLNEIVNSYYEQFRKSYSVINMFSAEMYNLSENEETEFTDMYDLYSASLIAVDDYLDTLVEQDPTFVSQKNNTSFNQLLSELNILRSNLDLFNSYIATNNIWRNSARAKDSLEKSKQDINDKLTPIKNYIETLEKQIKSIQPNRTTSNDPQGGITITETYPTEYYKFQSQLDDYNRQVLEMNLQLASIERRLEQFKNGSEADEGLKFVAMSTITDIETKASAYIEKVNATIEDYFEASFITSSVRHVQAPIVTRSGLQFNLLIVFGAAIVVGILVACLVTAIKISVANTVRKKQEAERAAENNVAESKEKDKE